MPTIPTESLENLIKTSIKDTFQKAGYSKQETPPKKSLVMIESVKAAGKSLLKEAIALVPKTFLMKTEFISSKAKEAHELLYKGYVEAFNKVSSQLDSVNTEEASANHSNLRALKLDEQYNLNALKLHELYFTNISDQASSISVDSLPYMRLARDFGSFDRWQFDFRACAIASREGWAVCYYEPYRNVYLNCVVDGHSVGVPLGGIPIVVMDMWSHAYFRDYLGDKKSYVNAMMREVNWNVVEARMTVAEKSNLDTLFRIQPIYNSVPDRILQAVSVDSQAPIQKDQVDHKGEVVLSVPTSEVAPKPPGQQ